MRCVGGDLLEVVVEQKEDASMWSATFAAKCEHLLATSTPSAVPPAHNIKC